MIKAPVTARCAEAKAFTFDVLSDGRAVAAARLVNGRGVSATVIALGATLQALTMPDREGRSDDVHLGYNTAGDYLDQRHYVGATVGRFANRIAGGRFDLDGCAYAVPVNDGAHALHGGPLGFDTALWEIVALSSGSAASVTLRHVSPDGDMGFPGAVTVLATYCLNPDNHLTIDYRATTDRSTVVSVTNHAYWNLAGLRSGRSAMDHQVMIAADRYLPVDCGLIPTGELRSVDDSPFDFRRPYAMGARLGKATEPQLRLARGYDHTWVIGDRVYPEPRLAAVVSDPGSGRGIELWSNQPGLQLYSGHSGAIALEPQMFPDAPNRPNFRSARLEPGQIYRNLILYKLTTGFNPAD